MAKAPITIEEKKVPITPIAEKPPLTIPTPSVSIAEKPSTQPLPPVEIINKSTIKLDRIIYSRKGFNQTVGTDFEEFQKKEDTFSPTQFFQLYDSLFFDIPKLGNNSHAALIRRSKEYLGNFNPSDPKDSVIDNLNNKIIELEQELLLANQADPEHPFFKNGTIVSKKDSSDYYYMDKGFKRKINYTEDFHRTLIKVLGYNPNDYPDGPGWYPSATNTLLSQIPTGPNLGEGNFEQPTYIKDGELFIGTNVTNDTKDAQINSLRNEVSSLKQTIEDLEELLNTTTIGSSIENNEGNDSEGRLEDRDFGGQGNFNNPFR